MKYRDPETGEFKELYVKAADTLPVGTEVDYEGEEVPAGWEEIPPIVESGENENGTWIKWADGTMICTKTIVGTVAQSEWVSPIYFGDVQCGNWAQTFAKLDGVSTDTDSSQSWFTHYFSNTSSAGTVRLISLSNLDKGYTIRLTAIGKWK